MPYKTLSWEEVDKRIEMDGKVGRALLEIIKQNKGKGFSVTFYYKGDNEPEEFDLEENLTEREKEKNWDWSSVFDSFLLPPPEKTEFFTPGALAAIEKDRSRKATESAAIEAGLGSDAQRFKQVNNRVRELIVKLGGGTLEGIEFISDPSGKLSLSGKIFSGLIKFPKDIFQGFSEDYLKFLSLAKLSEDSVIQLDKGPLLDELMTKMEDWATEWEHWYSREAKRSKELGSAEEVRRSNPFPEPYHKLVSTKPDPKLQEADQTISQKPVDSSKKLEAGQEKPSDSSESTQAGSPSLQQDEPGRNFYTHFYQEQQAAPKLSELTVGSIQSRARTMDVETFQKAASAWQDKVNEKNSSDPKYQNVHCELFDQGGMKTTVQVSKRKFQTIEHVYHKGEGCPKVDISDPPEDQTIFLFIESSQAMAPLVLQTPCSKETALKLLEASLLTGVEINLGSENLKQLRGDERYEKLVVLGQNPEALTKFRETIAKQSDYRLGEISIPELEPKSPSSKPFAS